MPAATLILSRIFFITCFLILLAICAYPAFAQITATSSTTRREAVKEKIETRKENIAQRLDDKRTRIATKEAALRTRLNAFKNQKKATAAARINENLNNINENRTASMQKHLDKMLVLLQKLEERVNSGSPDVKDKSAALAAIASSKSVIATTSAAVTAQTEKDYTIVVSSESRIKIDAKAQRDLLHKDLLALRKLIIDAKQSVIKAIRTAKSGAREATASGQL